MSIPQIEQIVRRYFDPNEAMYDEDDDQAHRDHGAICDAALEETARGEWTHTGVVWNLIRLRIAAIIRQDQQQIESLYDQIVAILHPTGGAQ